MMLFSAVFEDTGHQQNAHENIVNREKIANHQTCYKPSSSQEIKICSSFA